LLSRTGFLEGHMTKTLRMGLTMVVLAMSVACADSNSATAPSGVTSATSNGTTFNVSVRPSPITATRCNPQCAGDSGAGSFAFSAGMTIALDNAGAVGATINSVTLTATAEGVTFAPLTFSGDEIRGQAGTNHVDGHTTLSIPLTIVYNTPTGTANLGVSVGVQITDDRTNQVTATAQVNVI
jgi:hypothetical protein